MDGINVNFRDGVVDDGYMWVFDNVLQAVCKINLDTMVMDIVQKYEGEKEITIWWIVQYQKSLYMVRRDIPGILIYDRMKKRFYERFDVPEVGHKESTVSTVIQMADDLWIFLSWLENSACRYDMKKGKYYVENRISNLLKSHKSNPKIFSPYFHKESDSIWMVSYVGDAYWRFDLNNKTGDLYEFNDADMKLSGICHKNGKKWFSFIDSGNIMCVDADGKCDIWEDIGNENEPFANIISAGDYVVFMPRQSTNMAILNTVNSQMRKVEIKKESEEKYIFERMRNYCIVGNSIFLFPIEMDDLFVFNLETGEVSSLQINASFSYDLEQLKGKLARNNMIREDKNTRFRAFLSYFEEVK